MMKLTYPACFYPHADCGGYMATVPDLPGCTTEGTSLADAILMAVDAASSWILSELENGNNVPLASRPQDAKPDSADGFVSMIVLDIDAYAEKYGSKAVRKNVTLPAWLNTFAEAHNINFSKVLKDALSKMYEAELEKHSEKTEYMERL